MRPAAPSSAPRSTRPRAGSFRLRKWYLDVTADDGRAAILYHAHLRWGPLRFSYAGLLSASVQPVTVFGGRCSSAPVISRASSRAAEPPRAAPFNPQSRIPDPQSPLAWSCPRLGVSGTWHPAAPAAERTLLERDEGAVLWSCLMPRARASVSIGGQPPIEGWGYVERLDLTLRPWRLPIDTLRWGRFTSDTDSLVWIQWLGPEPRTLVLHDGREVSRAQITGNTIAWPDGHLDLSAGLTLRRGQLGSTVLADTPLLRVLAPRAARALSEHKTLSRALLHTNTHTASGWAIHETVLFRELSP